MRGGVVMYLIRNTYETTLTFTEIVVQKVPCVLSEHHVIKAYWGSGCIVPRILILELDGSEWSVSRPCHFAPRERATGTQWIGVWVGPRAGLDAVVKRKIPSS
jgi:hypothetical protein